MAYKEIHSLHLAPFPLPLPSLGLPCLSSDTPGCAFTSGPSHLLPLLPEMFLATDTCVALFLAFFWSQLKCHLIRQAFIYYSISNRTLPLTPLYFLPLHASSPYILHICWFFDYLTLPRIHWLHESWGPCVFRLSINSSRPSIIPGNRRHFMNTDMTG